MSDRKPRILFIMQLPPPVIGAGVVCQQVKDNALLNQRIDCRYINYTMSRTVKDFGHRKAYKFPRFVKIWFKTLFELIFHRYDATYITLTCHGPKFLRDCMLAIPAKLLSRQLIIHQHNIGLANDLHKRPYKWLFPLVYRNAKVILLSPRLYDDIKDVAKPEQIRICPNGMPRLQEGTFRSIDDKQREEGAPVRILFLANLYKVKGVLTVVEACGILKERGVRFTCDIVGDYTKQVTPEVLVQQIKDNGVTDEITFHGPLYNEEKHEAFERADIFTLPSGYEAFPLVILEAMQHSLPVVGSTTAGIPDMVREGENGFIVEPKDAGSLADRLQDLIEDGELRKKMGRRSYEIYDKEYTLTQWEKRIVEAIEN